jgi:hypothetical protein
MELTESGAPAYVDDSNAVPNGCLADTNMWFTLHPATKTSHFFERVDEDRPLLEGGIDKAAPHIPFSYTGAKMFSFMAIMFSFPLNPHMVQRSVPHPAQYFVGRLPLLEARTLAHGYVRTATPLSLPAIVRSSRWCRVASSTTS